MTSTASVVSAITGDQSSATKDAARLRALLRSGITTRWHTYGPELQQSVAAHSWGVAMLIIALKPDASAELLRAAILHDAHESVFGDLPNPTKQSHPILKSVERVIEEEFRNEHSLPAPQLTAEEKRLLEICDRLEAMFFLEGKTVADREALIRRLRELVIQTANGEI